MLAAIRDVIGEDPALAHVYRPDARFAGRIPRREIPHVITMMREQENGWRTWFDEEDVHPIAVPYPVLRRNLMRVVAMFLEALSLDPTLAPAPVLEGRSALRRMGDRYRADAKHLGLPT